jgi:Domain of unknown function (DUF4041)/T5orf172 domain
VIAGDRVKFPETWLIHKLTVILRRIHLERQIHMLSTLLGLSALVLAAALTYTQLKLAKHKKLLRKYDSLFSKEDFEKQLDSNINLKQGELDQLASEQAKLNAKIRNLQQKLSEVEESESVQSFGFYKSKYNFGSSEEYKRRLDHIRSQQSKMLKDKTAAICHVPWEVEGSKKKGQKMTDDFLTLILRAFNGECDAAIFQVKYNNANKLETRINKAFQTINKLSETNRCAIMPSYRDLKLEELYLTHEFLEKKQEEAEEQRRIREQMREEERERREIEKVRKDSEQEVKIREQALEKARREVEQATGQQREQLELKLQQMNLQLEEALAKRNEISRAQMTKSGHIYIISNVGSFGDNVYKIGMTRRIDPEDRIKELSGASVPFPFDIHAMIFSENVPETENLLHQYFRDKSVNKVNERKEFFKVTLDEISSAVEKIAAETQTVKKAEIQFTKVAEAEQYRKTLAIELGETQAPNRTYTPTWDEGEEESETEE